MSRNAIPIRSLVAVFRQFRTVVILPHMLVTALALPLPAAAQALDSTASQARVAANRVQAKAQMLTQPLRFEPNHGQVEAGVDFVSRGRGYSLLLSGSESTFVAAGNGSNPAERSIHMQLVGADVAVKPRAEKPLPGQSNYLLGNDPTRWVHGVQQFQQVRLANAYPGIDVLYYGNQRQVEHDFIISPGTDPAQIRMEFSGATSKVIAKSGELQLMTREGSTVSLEKPIAYQTLADGTRHTVEADYAASTGNAFGFQLGEYDHALPLVIDPVVITYSTYFGGNAQDDVVDLKLDAAGNIYILMTTDSTDLPMPSQIAGACVGACGPKNPDTLTQNPNTTDHDFYLAKLDPTGQQLLFATYIGGSGDDVPGALSLSSDGGIYIAGDTMSADFPLVNQYSSTLASTSIGGYPFFSTTITRLSTDGSTILYSSLIGGGLINFSGQNGGRYLGTSTGSIAAGPNGIAYMLGYAETAGGGFGNFVDAKNTSYSVGLGTFLAKFDTTKTGYDSLVYATTFGQPGDRHSENLWAVALDSKQNVWLFGNGGDSHPIPTPNAVQPICGDGGQCHNAYLYELDPAGNILYATFLGGTMSPDNGVPNETPLSIALDPSDNIYLTGGTNSIDFPTTKTGATPTDTSGGAGFLTKLSPGGLSMLYSIYTYTPFSLAITPSGLAGGAAFLLGTGFPVKNGFTYKNPGQNDAVFQVYDTTQAGDASLLVSSYLGAGAFTVGQAAAFDAAGNLLFGGYTESTTLPVVNSFQSTCSATCSIAGTPQTDGFITRIQLDATTGGLTLLSATQSFPNTAVGSTSAVLTSTLSNTTSTDFAFTSSFTDSKDFQETDTCGSVVAAGASCVFSFTFTPQATGPLTSTFTLTGTATPSTTLTVGLSGTGVAPTATLTPATYNYGNVTLGNLATQNFTLTSTSSTPLNLKSYSVSGPGFSVPIAAPNPCPLSQPGTCVFLVQFAPTMAGAATGTLTVTDDAGTQTVALTGTGVAPTATLTPTTYNYGNVTLGNLATQNFTLTSTSSTPLNLKSYSVSGPGFSLPVSAPNPCPLSQPGTCVFLVQFAPTVAGAATGTLTVTDDAGTQTVALTGTGVSPTVTLTPTTYNYGNVTLGNFATQNFTLTSTNSTSLNLKNYSVSGPGFSVPVAAPNPCPLSQPGTCVFLIQFAPTLAGAATGTLTVTDDAGTQTVALIGTGVAPTATLTPATYNYGNVTLGNLATQNFTLTSTSSTPLNLKSYSVSGPGFSVPIAAPNPCPLSQPGTCVFLVQFAPTVAGATTGTLTVTDDAGTQTVALTGTGVSPTATLTPTTYNYGNVTLGNLATQNFTLTSTTALNLKNYSVSGPGFSVPVAAPNPCPLSQPGTCVFLVQFAPTVAGAATGTLTVTDDAGTQTVALTGTGVAPTSPDFTLTTPTATALTVNRGSSASLIFQVTSASGSNPFNSPITFSISGLPSGVTAVFSPSSVTPGANGASTTLMITASPSSAQNKPMSPFPPRERETALGISAAALMAGLFGFRRRLNARLLLCLCVLGLVGAITGCGSDVNFNSAASTSNVVVTATSGSISHTITVALTVR